MNHSYHQLRTMLKACDSGNRFPLPFGWISTIGLLLLFLASTGCRTSPVEGLITRMELSRFSPTRFTVCRDYGCYREIPVSLTDAEWTAIRTCFRPRPETPPQERVKIADAISLLEQIVGRKAGASEDLPESPLLTLGRKGQMDCVDETVNTTLYLTLMKTDGLMTFHKVGQPIYRGKLIDCFPHNAATIVVAHTGERFVVDSFFHANGHAPEIIPEDLWLSCWRPPGKQEVPIHPPP